MMTYEDLKKLGACQASLDYLRNEHGDDWHAAVRACTDLSWFEWLLNALGGPALAEYQRVRAPALAECQRVLAAALAEYQRVEAAALAEWQRVEAPARAEYQRICLAHAKSIILALVGDKVSTPRRAHGRYFFEDWSVADPEDKKLLEAMHTARYNLEALTKDQSFRVLAAAEAFLHFASHPATNKSILNQLRLLRRAVRDNP